MPGPRRAGARLGPGRSGSRPPLAAVRPGGRPGRGRGGLRVPAAGGGDPSRGDGLVPGAGRSAERFQLGDALVFADTATLLLLEAQDQAAGTAAAGSGPGGQPAGLAVHRAEIDQATGMLTEQLGVGIAEAFIRLRAYAYAHDRRLSDLAGDIVARRLRLRPDPDPREDDQA